VELLWRTAFRVSALRLRALASLLLVLERRRIARPKARDHANFQSDITAVICRRRNGVQGEFALQKSRKPDISDGSKSEENQCPSQREVSEVPETNSETTRS
jgi:hypothetical protein